jgi:hypothetical protein
MFENNSNYLRFANEAYHPRDRNVEMVSHNGQIYYRTTRNIGNPQGWDEILTCYGSSYSRNYAIWETDTHQEYF